MNHFALTIVGRDRAGIVSQVTKILFDLGCNIADSSCSILGGQFAMILILGHPEFTSLESFGVSTMLYPALPMAMYIILTIMIVLAANVAALLPAWKATHLVPSEAIRTY